MADKARGSKGWTTCPDCNRVLFVGDKCGCTDTDAEGPEAEAEATATKE